MSDKQIFSGLASAMVVLVFSAQASQAQPMSLETPSDSPLWWSLSSEVSREDLRAAFLDEKGHLDRYRQAEAAGLVPFLIEERVDDLVFFLDWAKSPEYMPMWMALAILGGDRLPTVGEEGLRRELLASGMSDLGAENVLDEVARQQVEERRLFDATREDTVAFLALQREAFARHGKDETRAALARGDYELLPGVTAQHLQKLHAAWRTNPAAESSAIVLPELRAELDAGDWLALLEFLRREIASKTGIFMDFE